MKADTLITMVLDEGRKVRLRRVAAGSDGSFQTIPAFGRKVRRFSSRAPLIDKGGELSMVDKFGANRTMRPNQTVKRGDYLNVFGTEPKSKKRQDRHQALMHLVHHMHQYAMDNPAGITQDEYQEMSGHAERLLRAEARSTYKAARRMARKSGMFADSAKYKDRMSTPKAPKGKVPKYISKVPRYVGTNLRPTIDPNSETGDFNDPALRAADAAGEGRPSYDATGVKRKLRFWTHDGLEHTFTGALPTGRGEHMASTLGLITSDGEQYPEDNGLSFEKIHSEDQEMYTKMQRSLYKLAQAHGSLPIQHDHKTTLEMARVAL